MMHSGTHPNGANAPMQWDTLAGGFADPVHDSQAVFRVLLDALARPARLLRVAPAPALLAAAQRAGAAPAALAALYTLCDLDTPVWLGPDNPALSAALRFHTGAPLAHSPAHAAFAWSAQPEALPPLAQFALGDAQSPEHSSTLLLQVSSFAGGPTLRLSGPGIQHSTTLAPQGLPARFWQERAALSTLAPCGLDVYLVCGDTLAGLPRTTRVEEL
jgi:alpha-D-ribose 1-methylphosphonate 5-triphosphate synthase subunit PhnH